MACAGRAVCLCPVLFCLFLHHDAPPCPVGPVLPPSGAGSARFPVRPILPCPACFLPRGSIFIHALLCFRLVPASLSGPSSVPSHAFCPGEAFHPCSLLLPPRPVAGYASFVRALCICARALAAAACCAVILCVVPHLGQRYRFISPSLRTRSISTSWQCLHIIACPPFRIGPAALPSPAFAKSPSACPWGPRCPPAAPPHIPQM